MTAQCQAQHGLRADRFQAYFLARKVRRNCFPTCVHGHVAKSITELWELTQDGILVKNPTAPETALQAPDFLVYAEIFDFAPCSPVEKIGFLAKSLSCVTSVGVQVRIGNTATGEYVPGTSDPLSPEGKYVHTVNAPLFGDARLAFDQSAIGKATLKATRYAVLKALQRFQRAGL